MAKITIIAVGVVVMSSSFAFANTITVTQTWNAKGYGMYDFTLAQNSLVDIQFTSGYSDPTISLMNSVGAHIITADEESTPSSRLPHLTQSLVAGSYSLLIAYCCEAFVYFENGGGAQAFTDGVNDGFYLVGGVGTLTGATAYLNDSRRRPRGAGFTTTFTLSTTLLGPSIAVPEPASLPLFPIGIVGLAAFAAATRFQRD